MSKRKQQEINGIVYTYTTDWIHELESEEHWRLYWTQQRLMTDYLKQEDSILEIGVGTGFTANYLRSKGYKVTTLDIDKDKNPDIVANIVDYSFTNSYDYICAFEVLEHIPFEEVTRLITNISNHCRKGIFVSIPKSEWVLLRADVKLPLIKRKHLELTIPRTRILEPNHFWEIGKTVSLNQLDKTFLRGGFKLTERFKRFSRCYMLYTHS